MVEIIQKIHVCFDWKLGPDYRHARYYEVYAQIQGIPFPVLMGATKGADSDRIYPLNHPEISELGTTNFAYDTEISEEEYLQEHSFPFTISDFDMSQILEYLKQHAPKE